MWEWSHLISVEKPPCLSIASVRHFTFHGDERTYLTLTRHLNVSLIMNKDPILKSGVAQLWMSTMFRELLNPEGESLISLLSHTLPRLYEDSYLYSGEVRASDIDVSILLESILRSRSATSAVKVAVRTSYTWTPQQKKWWIVSFEGSIP